MDICGEKTCNTCPARELPLETRHAVGDVFQRQPGISAHTPKIVLTGLCRAAVAARLGEADPEPGVVSAITGAVAHVATDQCPLYPIRSPQPIPLQE